MSLAFLGGLKRRNFIGLGPIYSRTFDIQIEGVSFSSAAVIVGRSTAYNVVVSGEMTCVVCNFVMFGLVY